MNNKIEKFQVDVEANRINKFDEQFYQIVVPGEKELVDLLSVTGYLQVYPKGVGFKLWLQRVGENADAIRDEAGQIGTTTHRFIEATLRGETVTFENMDSSRNCSLVEWERFLSWCLWYQEYKEKYNLEPLFIEQIVFDLDRKTAGTIDLIGKVTVKDKKETKEILKVFDWKTGQYVGDTAEIQVSIYQDIANKMKVFGNIEGAEIVQLYPKLNRKGYRVRMVEDIKENLIAFESCQRIFNRANPNFKPKYLSYPNTVNLEELNTEKLNLTGEEK